MKVTLTLAELANIDNGKIAAVFQNELRRVVGDCVDRPTDDSARKVNMTVMVKPQESDGVCATVEMEVVVKSSVPDRRTRPYQMEVHARGDVILNDASPDNIRQGTLDEVSAE